MGCDDIPLAQFSTPPLTTIRFDNGQQLDLLIENILATRSGEPVQEVPLPSLSVIVRASA
jgi:DNA-binding LacI/PurR family transcriptional regulator